MTSRALPRWRRRLSLLLSVAAAPALASALTVAPAHALSAVAWPGGSAVSTADASNVFGEDLSGLAEEGSTVLWAAQNSGKLWRLVPNGSGGWTPDTANGWKSGKTLKYPTGSGSPDDEGVTLTGAGSAGGVYVSTERDDSDDDTSRLSVLRYDVSGTATSLTAAREWNLTSSLPSVDSNEGLEGITWIPDGTLTAAGFKDESTGAAYNPAGYTAHSGGVFFVALETKGTVYGYVLKDDGTYVKVATISTGLSTVAEVQWEPQASRLWAVCDDHCSGQHRTYQIGSTGSFAATAIYNRPSGMGNYNNEGFAIASAAECSGGVKPVFWSDDDNDGKHALRRGTLTC